MPLAPANGQRLYFEDSGDRGRPAIVLSHGLLMDHEMFAPQVEALGSRYRVITWDQRCHGRTESTPGPFSYWDSADDLKGLLDDVDVDRAVIGGMSQGGFVSLRFALRYPKRVAGLVLIDTQAGPEDPDKAATYELMLEVWEAEGLPEQMGETVAAIILGNEWPGRGPWIEKWRNWPPTQLRPAFQALVGREDIHDRLREIKAPSLVIHGTADTAIDLDLAQRLCSELADCHRLVTVEGAGHASNLTHPEPVNRAFEQFLGELALTGAGS